jgi:hypothetical protein
MLLAATLFFSILTFLTSQAASLNQHVLGYGAQAEAEWAAAGIAAPDLPAMRKYRLERIRAELKRDGRLGESVQVGGWEFAVGDRVVARRNDRERAVDNGMGGTVESFYFAFGEVDAYVADPGRPAAHGAHRVSSTDGL